MDISLAYCSPALAVPVAPDIFVPYWSPVLAVPVAPDISLAYWSPVLAVFVAPEQTFKLAWGVGCTRNFPESVMSKSVIAPALTLVLPYLLCL